MELSKKFRPADKADTRDIGFGEVKILDASPEDATGIAAVQQETWLSTYANEKTNLDPKDIPPWKTNSPQQIARWEREITDQSGTQHVWSVKDGKNVIGYCKAIRSPQNNEIESIYILQGYQGKGIGRQLIAKALDYIGPEKDVVLKVAIHNAPTITFYQELGFEKTDKPTKQIDYPSGKFITLMEMVRRRTKASE